MRHKSGVFEQFQYLETLLEHKLKIFKSDNGREYTLEQFQDRGIIHVLSSLNIHEHKSRAKGEMRTIIESTRTRSMLIYSEVDIEVWPEATNTTCYLFYKVVSPKEIYHVESRYQ